MSANRCFEEFKARVKAQGGTVLEPEWRGKDTRHRVRCAQGHDSSPTPGHVRDGRGICPKCSRANLSVRKGQIAWNQFKTRVEAQGGTVLEPKWRGALKPHRIRCSRGHERSPRPADVQQGKGICFACSGRDSVIAEENFNARLAEFGATLLESKWLGKDAPHHVRCAQGHDCYPAPGGIRGGQGICWQCYLNNRVHPWSVSAEAAFRARLAEFGATLLQPKYINSKAPHHVRCAQGHDCWPAPCSLQNGRGVCDTCSRANADVFYVVTSARRVKPGITSGDPKDRLKAHRLDGFDTVELLLPGLPHLVAPELEQAVLKTLGKAGYRPVRGREYFSIEALDLVLSTVDEFAYERGLDFSDPRCY